MAGRGDGGMVAALASKRPLRESEILGVVLIEGTVSIHPRNGNKLAKCITYRSQENRVQLSQGKDNILAQVTSQQEIESRLASFLAALSIEACLT